MIFIRGAGFPEAWEKVPLRSDRAPEKVASADASATEKRVEEGVAPSQTSVNGKVADEFEQATDIPKRAFQPTHASSKILG